ncbi:hypothetical protein ACJJTC_008262 [Scirpophaga incertulas]
MNAKMVLVLVCVLIAGRVTAFPSLGSLLNKILGTGDDKEDINIVKDVTDTLSDVTRIVDDLGAKWKMWVKNLNCTVRSDNLVTCVLTNSEAKDNPDSWKVSLSEVTIPNAPPEGYANKTLPQMVKDELSECLSD